MHVIKDYTPLPRVIMVVGGDTPIGDQIFSGFVTTLSKSVIFEYDYLSSNFDAYEMRRGLDDLVGHQRCSLIFTIGMFSTNLIKVYFEKKRNPIPVVFAGIPNPHEKGLVQAPLFSGNNLTGISTIPRSYRRNIEMLLKIKPDTKTVGILYNKNHINSRTVFDECKLIFDEKRIDALFIAIQKKDDIKHRLLAYIEKCDVVFMLRDVFISGIARELITICNTYQKLLYASDTESILHGAALGFAASDYHTGVQGAEKARIILTERKHPSQVPIDVLNWQPKLFMNKYSLDRQGLNSEKIWFYKQHGAAILN